MKKSKVIRFYFASYILDIFATMTWKASAECNSFPEVYYSLTSRVIKIFPLKYQIIKRAYTNKTKSKRSQVLEGMWGKLESLLVSESVKAQPLQKTQHATTPKQANKIEWVWLEMSKKRPEERREGDYMICCCCCKNW